VTGTIDPGCHLDRARHLITWLLGVACILDALIAPGGNNLAELVTGLVLMGYVQAGELAARGRRERP
jgi:hypothetical protein